MPYKQDYRLTFNAAKIRTPRDDLTFTWIEEYTVKEPDWVRVTDLKVGDCFVTSQIGRGIVLKLVVGETQTAITVHEHCVETTYDYANDARVAVVYRDIDKRQKAAVVLVEMAQYVEHDTLKELDWTRKSLSAAQLKSRHSSKTS